MLAKVDCTWCGHDWRAPSNKITVVTQKGKVSKLFKTECPRCRSVLQWKNNNISTENVHLLVSFGAQLEPVYVTAGDLASFQKGLQKNDCLVEVIENERNSAINNREKT